MVVGPQLAYLVRRRDGVNVHGDDSSGYADHEPQHEPSRGQHVELQLDELHHDGQYADDVDDEQSLQFPKDGDVLSVENGTDEGAQVEAAGGNR